MWWIMGCNLFAPVPVPGPAVVSSPEALPAPAPPPAPMPAIAVDQPPPCDPAALLAAVKASGSVASDEVRLVRPVCDVDAAWAGIDLPGRDGADVLFRYENGWKVKDLGEIECEDAECEALRKRSAEQPR